MSSRITELPEEEMQAIIKDYAGRGLVITPEQVVDQINQLVEIMRQAHREGLLTPAMRPDESHPTSNDPGCEFNLEGLKLPVNI